MIGFLTYTVVIYCLLGLGFALPFCFRWAQRIDPVAQTSTLGFRLLCVPGAAILWPLLLIKLRSAK